MSKVILTLLIWLIVVYLIDTFTYKETRRGIPIEWIIPAFFISAMVLSWILIAINS
jgi:RsiW-degrading membrane proteinase PrsW (M82 family)